MKNLDIKQIQREIGKYTKLTGRHAAFIAILIALFSYIAIVWQISNLSTAEPTPGDQTATATKIPKIDQHAINQIQSLEQSNTQVHSLFVQARNNPFQE